MRLYRVVVAVVAAAGLAAAPAAYAQSPTGTGYDETDVIGNLPESDGGVLPEVVSGGGGDDAATPPTRTESGAGGAAGTSAPTSGSSLPFTGADVGIIAVLGLVLLGTGFALRRGVLSKN
jgi:hypothetical protein